MFERNIECAASGRSNSSVFCSPSRPLPIFLCLFCAVVPPPFGIVVPSICVSWNENRMCCFWGHNASKSSVCDVNAAFVLINNFHLCYFESDSIPYSISSIIMRTRYVLNVAFPNCWHTHKRFHSLSRHRVAHNIHGAFNVANAPTIMYQTLS